MVLAPPSSSLWGVTGLTLLASGKVRELYELGDDLLMVASDRISTYDVVHPTPIPDKGKVLTALSVLWFDLTRDIVPNHLLSTTEGVPDEFRGRGMRVQRLKMLPVECVVRGYLSGSAWAEYRQSGTLAGEPLEHGLVESARLDPPIFSPATKAEQGHDENVTFDHVIKALGRGLATRLRQASLALYEAGRNYAAERGIIIADTKFEFGTAADGTLMVIDEILTPDSSRFWPADRYQPGRGQPSFDKQPLRDYLAEVKRRGDWNGEAPPPPLPAEVVTATSERYRDAYRRMTGRELA
jgi:phosphoribosylaminoimidazole-succinocarboxamide synthase